VLEYYKEFVNRQGNHNMIYFSTWNEFGEGHWLAPSGLNGFGYADEWRNAFTDANKVHDDVVPTINQMNRICKLYNDNRSPIRAWLLEDYSVETKPVLEWEASDETFNKLVKAVDYDKDVDDAFEAGEIKGRNTNIHEMRSKPSDGMPSGLSSQAPVVERPKRKVNSLIADALKA
jgi:hypothetical protein